MKITYYAATSLDGFIAKEDGDLSWLDDLNIDPADTGYDYFFASVDGLVMGRNTYDFIYNYGLWPYSDKPTWVCTSTGLDVLDGANLETVKTAEEVIKQAESQGLKHLWLVGGGKLAALFLNSSLLTHLSISEMPVTLESGIPLIAGYELENIGAKKTEVLEKNGFNQLEITL